MISDTLAEGKWTERCNSTLTTMRRMERYDGHFYNWYDTLSLMPLHPKYVSTVDSGNLVGHLLTLRQGLLSLINEPVFKKKRLRRINNNFGDRQENSGKRPAEEIQKIEALLYAAFNDNNNSLSNTKKYFDELSVLINDLSLIPANGELKKWISKLSVQSEKIHDDLFDLAPWITYYLYLEILKNSMPWMIFLLFILFVITQSFWKPSIFISKMITMMQTMNG
jgi:hypothetical protein